MADLANLRTASLYINNQLLSRGLLRDGHTINFADPSGRESRRRRHDDDDDDDSNNDDGEDDTAHTMARVISVINDLILRRDRDAEHRESLATALRTVRAESLRQANDLQRALERHAEAQRRADLGEAAEASLRAQLAAAESANRKLREDAAKMRQLVSQTRASCATEVRKRDRQIDGLKKAVADAGRARGERRSPAITTITIGSGSGDQQQPPTSRSNFASPRSAQATPGSHTSAAAATAAATAATATTTEDANYTLRSETNAFLADLARGLSEDNEVLLSLVHHTSSQLKAMSGYVVDADDADGDAVAAAAAAAAAAPGANSSDYGSLVSDMEAVLEHLRTILTNPSFVPIEEVVQRESEIGRLRDGWEKMEDRWKEAVHLLDGWRRRMADSGRSVNVEEIQMGLRLSPVRVRSVAETTQGLGLRLPPLNEGLDAVEEEEEEEDNHDDSDDDEYVGQKDVQDAAPLGRSVGLEESLHLVPAPGCHDGADDEMLSDSDSDTSSVFYDEDEPNVQIIEQSISAHPFSRPSPPPSPPPTKTAPAKVTTAAVPKEAVSKTITVVPREKETAAPPPPPPSPPKEETAGKAAPLRPSHTAGNRRGAAEPTPAPAPAALEAKKDEPAAGTRGRRRPGEAKPVVAEPRPTVRPVGQRVAATGPSKVKASRPAAAPAPRPAARQAKPAARPAPAPAPATGAEGGPATAAQSKPARLATVSSRPASASSQASEASTTAKAAKARAPPKDTQHKMKPSVSEKAAATTTSTSTEASSTASASDPTPPPAAPSAAAVPAPAPASAPAPAPAAAPAPAPAPTTTSASRARSRSPLKIAASDAASRLPLRTAATAAANNIPPPSPALSMATIAAKLAASEREADAARVRAKLKAMRGGLANGLKAKKGLQPVAPSSAASSLASARAISGGSEVAATELDSVDPVKKSVTPVEPETELGTSIDSNASMGDDQQGVIDVQKQRQRQQQQQPLRRKRDPADHRRASKVASRRRSTLNPWELKTLMTGSTDSASADPAQAS